MRHDPAQNAALAGREDLCVVAPPSFSGNHENE